MEFKKWTFFMEGDIQGLNRIPEWARAEHMEMSIPLLELWEYPDSVISESRIFRKISKKNERVQKDEKKSNHLPMQR